MRPVRYAGALLLLSLAVFGAAQRTMEAESRWRVALAAQRTALLNADVASPDQPLWREAILHAREAVELAPDDPEVVRTLAQTYSYTLWHVRAWEQWLRFLDLGGLIDTPVDRELFAESGTELGYARYIAGNPEGALPFYRQVHEQLPDDIEALTWLGRIHFELDEPAQAAPYWERLAVLLPDDAGVAYYLNRTRQRLSVGVAASDAFQQGISLYDEGRLEEALTQFRRAASDNVSFVDAFVWSARTAFELGRPQLALTYWDRVLALDPDDARSRYFREVTQAQIDWGVAAAAAYYGGQAHYSNGDVAAANAAFVAAAQANPSYRDALVWAARTHQELGNPAAAIGYWQSVLALDPGDTRAAYFLNLARQQLDYGVVAGQAFVDGVAHYQSSEFEAAEEDFRAAVASNPNFTDAWSWLGRVLFTVARYREAAEAYERASALAPDNEDYIFFAEEARRLATP